MMELERLKALQAEFDREERAKQARLAGAQVLIEQIASRQEARNKELEMLEKEKLQLLQNIEKVKKEDEEIVRAKAHRVRVMQDEIKESNNQSLVLKEAARVAERKVEASILEHNRIQREREEAKIAAELRIREEKEKEIQRLRELQERAQDKAAELDQIRAQKAFEKAERAAKQAEVERVRKLEADMKVLEDDRKR